MARFTKTPSSAIQFCTKKEASIAAKRIGWRSSDAVSIEVMGFSMWSIGDDHGNLLTIDGFKELEHARN